MEILKLTLQPIDYLFVILYFLFVITVGIVMSKRAGKNRKAYFLSGQKLPWWLLGTSMVATTFSIDAPMLISGWVRSGGIVKNWEWWGFLVGQMFTTFFFAKLWRRTNVFNDAQFIDIRYSGKEASFLRGFRALYMGSILTLFVLGGGMLVCSKIGVIILGISPDNPNYIVWRWGIALTCGAIGLSYSTLSGFSAIVITDLVGFVLATTGSILVTVYICKRPEIGGLSNLVEQVRVNMPDKIEFFPKWDTAKAGMMSMGVVIVYTCVRWWAQIYGGAEPGGGSHVVQRLVSAKSEKDALLGSMWFNIAHYVVRPLPWIITGLASMFIFPLDKFTDHEMVYIAAIDFLPTALKGLVVAAIFAAFLSTIDTRLNLGTSYFVNDFYKPFLAKDKPEKHYIFVSRIFTVGQMILSLVILLIANNVKTLFFLYIGIGSGAGLVYILRFYWWRISAWSEITAMVTALGCMIVFRFFVYGSEQEFNEHGFEYMFISLIIVTASWLFVTLITKPCDKEKLKEFYRIVRPAGPLWKPISTELEKEEGIRPYDSLWIPFIGWLFSNPMTFGLLFGFGNLLLGKPGVGVAWLALAVICAFPTVWSVKKCCENKALVEEKA
jgi:Na+/proline symporter